MLSPVANKTKQQKPPQPKPPKLSRAQGALRISLKRRGALTVLDEFYQQGCLKARFPAIEQGHTCEGVLINTSGGLTDGDKLEQNFTWGRDTTARFTGQAAERIYRSRLEDARIDTRLAIGEQAHAQWLPQETILFNGGRLHRTNNITMAKGASLIATESLVFGRTAMSEEIIEGNIYESWRIRYDGALVFADGFHLEGNIKEQLSRPAIGNGAKAVATLLYVGSDAPDLEKALKQACNDLANSGTRIGCSLLPHVLVMRILGSDGAMMRSALGKLLQEMMMITGKTATTDLPKVWLC